MVLLNKIGKKTTTTVKLSKEKNNLNILVPQNSYRENMFTHRLHMIRPIKKFNVFFKSFDRNRKKRIIVWDKKPSFTLININVILIF